MAEAEPKGALKSFRNAVKKNPKTVRYVGLSACAAAVILVIVLVAVHTRGDDGQTVGQTVGQNVVEKAQQFGTFVRDWADTLTYDSGQVRYRTIHKTGSEYDKFTELDSLREADRQRTMEERERYQSSPRYMQDQGSLSMFRDEQQRERADTITEMQKKKFGGSTYQVGGPQIERAPLRYKQSFGDTSDLMPQGSFPGVPGSAVGSATALDAHLAQYGARGSLHLTNHAATSLKGLRPDPPVDMTKDFGILGSAQRQNIMQGLESQGVKSGFTMGTQWDFDALDRTNHLSPFTQKRDSPYTYQARR